jgi:hypothetical protein
MIKGVRKFSKHLTSEPMHSISPVVKSCLLMEVDYWTLFYLVVYSFFCPIHGEVIYQYEFWILNREATQGSSQTNERMKLCIAKLCWLNLSRFFFWLRSNPMIWYLNLLLDIRISSFHIAAIILVGSQLNISLRWYNTDDISTFACSFAWLARQSTTIIKLLHCYS